jgi:hypothetical protein
MKQFYTKYIENEGYAVFRRVPSDKEWIIFYCDTPEHAEQQAEVRNVWSEHQKYLRSFLPGLSNTFEVELQRKINAIERRTKHYPPTQSVISELIQLKDALGIRKGKNGSPI